LKNNNPRAIILIGSRARYPSPDNYADLDLILFALRPSELSTNRDWLTTISNPWISSQNYTSQGDPEWVLICENGLNIDLVISFADSEDNLIDLLANSPFEEVLGRGYRILMDKTEGGNSEISGQIPLYESPGLVTFNETFDRV
jgi:hypothetical protein